MNFLDQYTNTIQQLCSDHHVKQLYAFGSVLTDRFGQESDIDLVVDFEEVNLDDYADNYYGLKFSLEKILNRSIDLLEAKAIKNPFFEQALLKNRYLVYG